MTMCGTYFLVYIYDLEQQTTDRIIIECPLQPPKMELIMVFPHMVGCSTQRKTKSPSAPSCAFVTDERPVFLSCFRGALNCTWTSDTTGMWITPDTSLTGCCPMNLGPHIYFTRRFTVNLHLFTLLHISEQSNKYTMYKQYSRCMQTIESALTTSDQTQLWKAYASHHVYPMKLLGWSSLRIKTGDQSIFCGVCFQTECYRFCVQKLFANLLQFREFRLTLRGEKLRGNLITKGAYIQDRITVLPPEILSPINFKKKLGLQDNSREGAIITLKLNTVRRMGTASLATTASVWFNTNGRFNDSILNQTKFTNSQWTMCHY